METMKWNKEKYNLFRKTLFDKRDESYQTFQNGLFKEDVNLIGVRTPELKALAKEISKTDYVSFLYYNKHEYYEEKVIHGFLLGYIKGDFKDILSLLEQFIPYNDNWAINDLTCANMKVFKKNLEEGFPFVITCIASENPWKIRLGIVLLLDHYIKEEYIEAILQICDAIQSDAYYVKMAHAWLLSLCFIKFRDQTMDFFRKTNIDSWTYNKAISKITDSYRVSKSDKDLLKQMRRK